MLNMKKIVYIILLFSLVGYGCETTEKIDDFPLRPSNLVVNCFFQENEPWQFQVSRSLSVLDNASLPLLEDATIYIYENDILVDSITEPDGDKWYRNSNHTPKLNSTYRFEASAPGYPLTATAEEALPKPVPVEEVEITIIDSSFYEYYDGYLDTIIRSGDVEGYMDITFEDPAGEENYYNLSLYKVDSFPNYEEDTVKFIVERRPVDFEPENSTIFANQDYMSGLSFNDEVFNGQRFKIRVKYRDWSARSNLEYQVQLVSLKRSGYLYQTSIQAYRDASGDPFSEPVLIYSNIDNGYGIFTGSSSVSFSFNPNY